MKSRASSRIAGSVGAPRGFLAAGVKAGIKKSGKPDLALIFSEQPCAAAGVFTSNRVKAAPVLFCLKEIRRSPIHGVLINSGNANACTGAEGLRNTRRTASLASAQARKVFGASGARFLVGSTGRIGVQLPMEKIEAAMPALFRKLASKGGSDCARAIMTSDTVPKEAAARVRIGGRDIRIGGIAKGAGMIHPRMNPKGAPLRGLSSALHATMLCVITTDALVDRRTLEAALVEAVEPSFNSISVDGDTSTNDSVFRLANGAARCRPIRKKTSAYRLFVAALQDVALQLAKAIVQDGEGTSRVVTVRIAGAPSDRAAEAAGRAVINSMLVKSAWSGGDPNWGRILDAVGYSGAPIRPERVKIAYDGRWLVAGGVENAREKARVRKIVKNPSFEVTIDLGSGKGARIFYTTDLTEQYVSFNKTE